MRANPERLAWAVLLASFFTCVGLAIGVPVGIRSYVLHSRVTQRVSLEVQRAPLRAVFEGRGAPVAIVENRSEVPEGTTVTTDSTAGQLVMYAPHADDPVVARVQLYDFTEVTLRSARSPRFEASREGHEVVIDVHAGRVRISVADDTDRPTDLAVRTLHGEVNLSAGSYEVKVSDERTEVAVSSGQAIVKDSDDQTLKLGPAERAIVEEDQIVGPLPGARNLVLNGDFRFALGPDSGWVPYDTQTDPEQPPAQVSISSEQGRYEAVFQRQGTNHAEVGLVQEINYDVRDFSFLELHLALQIEHQDMLGFGGCGYLSSECPIMILLNYKDINGVDQEWRRGFYTGEPASGWPLHPWTKQIPPAAWQTFDSGNLMEMLADTPPAVIQRLTIYASGHTFHALVTEIELLAQE
ncbi:MAG: FecR domain-containing protein [Anaerolineales bacterium]|nr:FecR domain-containing protein [Anaerolineales bacterium]